MRTIFATLCLTIIFFFSENVRAEKYAGEFMALGGGARAMALGGTFIAVADDATTSFWNPAGLAGLYSSGHGRRDWEMNFMHSERFGDLIDYNYFSAAFPLRPGESSWGISIIHMGIDGIPIIPFTSGMIENSDGDDRFEPWAGERPNFNPLDFPLESVNDFALFLSYAQIMSFADLGVSLKVIRNDQVTDVSSFGLGIDIGLLRRQAWKDLALGVKLQDATGTYISWSTGKREFIYPALKVGAAYPFDIKSMNSTLLLACDGDFRFENLKGVSQLWIGKTSADFHFGAELLIRDMVALRGGYDMGRPTAGAGFILEDFGPWNISLGLDYALLVHDKLENTHRVSLMIAH